MKKESPYNGEKALPSKFASKKDLLARLIFLKHHYV